MTFPIDPTRIDAGDYGEHSATLEADHESAIEMVRNACKSAGMGIPVEFSPSALLNEKVDADRDPYYVLGACNPGVANRALDETLHIGGLFPCNMVIWEESPGTQVIYHVSIMRIARLLGIAADTDEWDDIVDETGVLTEDIFEYLEDHGATLH